VNGKDNWQTLSRAGRAELEAQQNELLRRHVRFEVYPFSAYYRRVFDEHGVRPEDVRTVDDLRRLPFTTKADLLAAQSNDKTKRDFVLIPTPELIRTHWPISKKLPLLAGGKDARDALRRSYTPHFATFTTGRSADPIIYLYTPLDIEILAKVGARMLDVHCIPATDARIVNTFPFAPHLAFWQAAFGGFETGRFMMSTGGGKVMGTAGNLRMLEKMGTTVIIGTPGYVYHLLREGAAHKTRMPNVRLVVLGAEKVTPGLKQKMAESLAAMGSNDVVISGTYGFTEARMAFSECPAKHDESPGYHVYPDLGVFEVIDPKTLEPVKEGETGELVYTPIAGHGTMIMRYRTGDLAVGGMTWEPCRWCGRTTPRISSELRRSSDQKALELTKIKGTLVDLSAMGSLLSSMPEVEEWQVVMRKKNDDPHELDQFFVRVSLRANSDARAFQTACARRIGDDLEVAPNGVEVHTNREMLDFLGMETEMKEKRFLDLRPK
jgi:phenylacetate-coenzyme A ligase PaaK-like adenylate-forming protein